MHARSSASLLRLVGARSHASFPSEERFLAKKHTQSNTQLLLPVCFLFLSPPPSPLRARMQEERLVHGKLEGLAYQYNTLLTSQLDEQRHFYQKQVGFGLPPCQRFVNVR